MAQFGYPLEDFLGGGIGYSPMYIKLDSIPGSSDLMGLGLNPKDFKDPFVISLDFFDILFWVSLIEF